VIWGIDLTPLVEDSTRDPASFVEEHIARFATDVRERLVRVSEVARSTSS
jgi:hypothetical protein